MKKIALFIIISAIIACCIAPPWQSIQGIRGYNIKQFTPEDYGFLWEPPSDANIIDYGRLSIQVGMLLFIGSCIVFSKHIFPKKKLKQMPTLPNEMPLKKKRKWIAKTLACLLVLALIAYGTVMTFLYAEYYNKYKIVESGNLRENNQLIDLGPAPTTKRVKSFEEIEPYVPETSPESTERKP